MISNKRPVFCTHGIQLNNVDTLHNYQDIQPKWQTAASEIIVSLGKKFKHEVMSELLENLVPGSLPHYFVILTLANFAQADGKIT